MICFLFCFFFLRSFIGHQWAMYGTLMIVHFHEIWIYGGCDGKLFRDCLFFFSFFHVFRYWYWVLLLLCCLFVFFSAQSAKGHFQGRHDNDASTTPAGTAYHTPSCALAQVFSYEGSTEFILGGRRRASSIARLQSLFRGYIFFYIPLLLRTAGFLAHELDIHLSIQNGILFQICTKA